MSCDVTDAVFALYKWFGQLYGVLPLSFDSPTQVFKLSRVRLWYCRTIALLLAVIYPCSYWVIFRDHRFPFIALSYDLVVLQFTLNYIIVVVLYLQVLFDPRTLMRCLNDLIEQSNAVLKCVHSPDRNSSDSVGRRLWLKTIVVDIVQSCTWYGMYLWLQRKMGVAYSLAFWFNNVAVMHLVAASNILLAALHWGNFLYHVLNEQVESIVGKRREDDICTSYPGRASCGKRPSPNHSHHKLNIIRAHHSALNECIQNMAQFYEVPLALMMLYQFLIIISESVTTMLYEHLAIVALRIHFHSAQLIGFFPLAVSGRFELFYESKFLTAWSYGIATALICIYPFVYAHLLPHIPYPKLVLVHHLVYVQCVWNYFTILLVYVRMLPARTTLRNMFNDFVKLYRAFNRGRRWKVERLNRCILRIAVKIILFDSMMCGLFAFYFEQFLAFDSISVTINWLLNIFAMWQSAIFTNMIVLGLTVGSHLYDLLNGNVKHYIGHARTVCACGAVRSKGAACESLRTIEQNHRMLTNGVKTFVHIVYLPMSFLLLVHFTIIISEIFYAYTSIVQDIQNEVDIPLGTYASSILFALFEAVQFYYIISASAEITDQAEKTGVLLNEFIQTDSSPRVERCIESFTIELLHQDFKINNCGLYTVDYTLMFSMIATITSYLIMLVQFQLTEI